MFQRSSNRKSLYYLLLLAVVMLAVSGSSCAPAREEEPVSTNPFTIDYKLDESNIAFFTDNDDIEILLASTPFYTGAQPLPSQNTAAYEKARAGKIEEIKKEAESLVKNTAKLKPGLESVHSAFLLYLDTGMEAEPQLKPFARETFTRMETVILKETVVEAEYNSIATEGVDDAFAKSFMDYLKVVKAVELGSLYLQDARDVAAYAALALSNLKDHKSAAIQNANARLDTEMKALDDLQKDLRAVASSMEKIDYGLRQLLTGDYYFTLAANDFITSLLPDLEAKTDSLVPGGGLTQEEIDAIQMYLSLFEKWQRHIRQQTELMPQWKLFDVTAWHEARPGVVYAAEPLNNNTKAVKSVSGSLKSDGASKEPKLWSTAKDFLLGRPQQKILGAGIDVAKIIVDFGVNLEYGSGVQDIARDAAKDAVAVIDNYNRGVSGVETLKTAEHYMKSFEETVGGGWQSSAELVFGKGWTAQAVGGAAKIVVGGFTGLARGIYKLADPTATPAQKTEGVVEVGFAMAGSGTVVKGSGLVKGLSKEASLAADSSLAYLRSAMTRAEINALESRLARAAGKRDWLEAISNARQRTAMMKLEEQLQRSIGKNALELERLLKVRLEKMTATAEQSLNNLLLKGFEEALKAGFRGDAREYLGYLYGPAGDESLNKLVSDAANARFGPAPTVAPPRRTTDGTTTTPTPVSPSSVKPDLTVTKVSFSPSSGKSGQTLSVTFTVSNLKGSPSGPFSNRISLATTQWGTDYSLGNFGIESLASGQSKTVTVTASPLPSTVPPGSYWVTVFTDGFQEVDESDENNNIGSSTPSKFELVQGSNFYEITLELNINTNREKESSYDRSVAKETAKVTLNFRQFELSSGGETQIWNDNGIFQYAGSMSYYNQGELRDSGQDSNSGDIIGSIGINVSYVAESSDGIAFTGGNINSFTMLKDEWRSQLPYLYGPGSMLGRVLDDLFIDGRASYFDSGHRAVLKGRVLNPAGETVSLNGNFTFIINEAHFIFDYTGTLTLKLVRAD